MAECLPLIEVTSSLTGDRGVSLPFTDECKGLVSSKERFSELVEQGIALGRERGWKYLELRDVPNDCEMKASGSFYRHDLGLQQSEAELMAGFEGSVRRAIRRAEGSGLTVEITRDSTGIEAYYQLHSLTRKRQGIPPQPLKFFRKIGEHLMGTGKAFVVLVRSGGRAVAGAVFFLFGNKGVYKFGGSDMAFQHLRPNQLVMWSGMRELRRLGAKCLGFGRTSRENEGLRRFKLSWGASEAIIHYSKYDFSKDKVVAVKDRSTGLHASIFRALPVWANQRLGRCVYRHLA